jgi:hypothetical protein
MRNSLTYLILFVFLTFLCACEKAIDLGLADTTPQYVIEGVLTSESGGCKVLVSQTKKFTDDNSFNGISGAQVSISNNGNTYAIAPQPQALSKNNIDEFLTYIFVFIINRIAELLGKSGVLLTMMVDALLKHRVIFGRKRLKFT